MEPWVVALLAAGIPAFAAALTYAISEWLRARRASSDRRAAVFARLETGLERVAIVETMPRLLRRWKRPDVAIVQATTSLFEVLPRREWVLVYWLAEEAYRLTVARGFEERAQIATRMSSTILAWRMRRRRMRERLAIDLASREQTILDYS
ncbi:hypothetical protein ESP51_03085 [Agromyces albus]|uniref:DUF4760 domain-containing protein n=1 Tax=Agromyces albus TaxID=205332 RepID=A0A4V1QYD7_9MICO|nr:hypothetical protein ESP51_03085 [Agromyces albus]